MLNRMRRLPSPALVIAFIALVAAIGTGSAYALSGSNSVFADDIRANAVGPSEIKANAVGVSEIRSNAVRGSELANNTVTSGKVKDNSLTGADIDESTLNLPNNGGGGNTGPNLISFTRRLAANESQTKTVGNFTVSSATNGAGTCGAIQLQSGNLDSQRSIGLAAAFANLAANSTATITAANTSQAFTGVSDDGTSSVSGVVGRAQQGNTCLLTGYLTGN